LGVAQYLWASSPLRRYSDLVNQRQLLAILDGGAPVYTEGDAELFAIMADFELTYSQYADLQSQMEHYWCLRWLQQENVAESEATVVRENLVRFDAIPLYVRAPDMPSLTPGTRVRVGVGRIDLLAATAEARFIAAA
jgi:exoribonuclease-2